MFAAYLCDEATLSVLRPVVIELGWQPEKCNKGGLRNAVQALSITASPNILLVDLSESGDPLNDINALAETGKLEEAQRALRALRRLSPNLTFQYLERIFRRAFPPDELAEYYLSGLRKLDWQ